MALLESLTDDDFPGTLWVAGTVQEERGLGGARTAAQFARPDWFMALDVAPAEDTPEMLIDLAHTRLLHQLTICHCTR